jgi:polyhydroxyalkanoate synthesis regulator phasin
MGFGAALVLALVVAGVVVFAQSGDDGATPDSQDGATDEVTPQFRPGPFRQGDGPNDDNQQLLADALGISVEELQAAYDQVRAAVIQQAVDEGLITEEQARQLQESDRPFRAGHLLRGLVVNENELLADALGIGVDELRDARNEARQARLDALVEAGRLTQEQADAIAAREAVSSYIDREALAQTIRDAAFGT